MPTSAEPTPESEPTPARESTPEPGAARWPAPLALALLLAVVGIGLLRYPSAPDPLPTHWNALLEPDAWGPRSLGAFLAPALIGFIPVVLLWVLPGLAGVQGAALPDTPPPAEHRTVLSLRDAPNAAQLRELTRFCHLLALLIAGLISLVTLLGWFGVSGIWAAVPVWTMVALLLAGVGLGIVRLRRGSAGGGSSLIG